MNRAMKSGDTVRLSVIRLLRASIKNREIERGKSKPLTEADLIEVVTSAVKQRKEAIELYTKGGRSDLAQNEQAELEILQEFLPKPLSPEELEGKIKEVIQVTAASGMKDMGRVMKALAPEVMGRADMALVSQRVKEILGQTR